MRPKPRLPDWLNVACASLVRSSPYIPRETQVPRHAPVMSIDGSAAWGASGEDGEYGVSEPSGTSRPHHSSRLAACKSSSAMDNSDGWLFIEDAMGCAEAACNSRLAQPDIENINAVSSSNHHRSPSMEPSFDRSGRADPTRVARVRSARLAPHHAAREFTGLAANRCAACHSAVQRGR